MTIDYQPTTSNDNWASTRTIKPAGIVCHSTAWPGKNAQAIRDYFNAPDRGASIHAAVDDRQVIQCAPWTKRCGHVGSGVNGSCNDTHIGIELCEPSGMKYNAAGSAITAYSPPEGYFEAAWDNMVELCAELCRQFGLDPMADGVIVGHCEAYKRGYGSNHADPMHWLAVEGRTMDDLRQDIADRMEGENMSYEQFKEYMERYQNEAVESEPSLWAAESCAKAVSLGIVKGNGQGAYNWQKPLTRESYVVMQDRAGLLK